MEELRRRILNEGEDLGDGILKVDGFLNHQVDTMLLFLCGQELARRFRSLQPNKVLTAEISGIGPALMTALELQTPVVFARKHRPITMSTDVYFTTAPSHTKGSQVSLMVSSEYLRPGDRVLIVDDFLASGETIIALARLVKAAGARLIGIGAVIEKTFEQGRELLATLGVPIFSLARVVAMKAGKIEVEE